LAAEAFCRSQALKSLRSADSLARSDLTVWLEKSIFLPGAGLVRTLIDSGSPCSWTSALPVSTLPVASAESVLGLPLVDPPGAAGNGAAANPNAATAAAVAIRPLRAMVDFTECLRCERGMLLPSRTRSGRRNRSQRSGA
jgi:hypothetical protein